MADDCQERTAALTADLGNPNRHHNHYDLLRRENKPPDDSTEDDGAVDLISSLPDAILQHILSFGLTELAIRTSVLSRRWKHVWCETPSLHFDSSRLTAESIDETLIHYTAPKIMSFHLCSIPFDSFPQINSWIEFAISRNAEKLSLEFDSYSSDYDIPDFLYSTSSLKQLTLELRSSVRIPGYTTVSWTSLKSLCLLCIALPDESAAKILSGCPFLESLTLTFYTELRFLDMSKSLVLERVEINCWDQDPGSMIYSLSPETPLSDFQKGLAKLQNVKKLTLGANIIQVLSFAEQLHGVPLPTFKLEALTLEITYFESVLIGITKMLQNSPVLRKITIHTKNNTSIAGLNIFGYLDSEGLDRDQFWRLKDGIDMEPEAKFVFWLVEFLLGSTKTVETMVVFLGGDISATGVQELLRMVPTLSRNNNNVSIVLKREEDKKLACI